MPRTQREPLQAYKQQYIFKFRDNSTVALRLDDIAMQSLVKKVNTMLTCRAMGSSSGFIMLDDNSFSFSIDDLLFIRKKEAIRSARDIRLEELNDRRHGGRSEDDDEEDSDDDADEEPRPRRPVGRPRKAALPLKEESFKK